MSFTIAAVRIPCICAVACAFAAVAVAQAPPQPQAAQPTVRYNLVNVCSLKAEDQALMERTLAGIPAQPAFSPEYEIARGRAGLDVEFPLGEGGEKAPEKPAIYARWVRIRREFPPAAPLLNAQYSLSVSEDGATEMLVLRLRDPQEVMQISISAGAAGMPPSKLAVAGMPAERISIERFGKSSVTLARCAGGGQSAYEPLFATATKFLASYKAALHVARLVPEELMRPGFAPAARKTPPASSGPAPAPAGAKTGH